MLRSGNEPVRLRTCHLKNNSIVMKVGIIMGSTSDWEVMSGAAEMLQELGIDLGRRI